MKIFYQLATALLILVSGSNYAATYTVQVGSDGFSPSTLNVEIGDQIDFILNLSTATGTHYSASSSVPGGVASWNYAMTCGTCLYSTVATAAGTYNYTDAASGLSGSFTATASGPTGVETQDKPSGSISQNFPNPFNGATNIQYHLSSNSGELVVTDLTGKLVDRIALNEQNGAIQIGDNLRSGSYLYTLYENGAIIETKRMIVK